MQAWGVFYIQRFFQIYPLSIVCVLAALATVPSHSRTTIEIWSNLALVAAAAICIVWLGVGTGQPLALMWQASPRSCRRALRPRWTYRNLPVVFSPASWRTRSR